MRGIQFAAMPTPGYDTFQSVTVSVSTNTTMGSWALDARLNVADARILASELLRSANIVVADQP